MLFHHRRPCAIGISVTWTLDVTHRLRRAFEEKNVYHQSLICTTFNPFRLAVKNTYLHMLKSSRNMLWWIHYIEGASHTHTNTLAYSCSAFHIQWTTSWLTAVCGKVKGRYFDSIIFLMSRLKPINALADISAWLTLWNIYWMLWSWRLWFTLNVICFLSLCLPLTMFFLSSLCFRCLL